MRRAPEIGLDEQNSSFWHLKAQKPINFCAKNVQVSENSGFPTAIFERAVLMRQPVFRIGLSVPLTGDHFVFDLPELFGEVNVIVMGVFKTQNRAPHRVQLPLAVFADLGNIG